MLLPPLLGLDLLVGLFEPEPLRLREQLQGTISPVEPRPGQAHGSGGLIDAAELDKAVAFVLFGLIVLGKAHICHGATGLRKDGEAESQKEEAASIYVKMVVEL